MTNATNTTSTETTTTTTETVNMSDEKTSKIDAAIAAAKARKAAKSAPEGTVTKDAPKAKKEEKAKPGAKSKQTDADRAAAKAKIEADREARKTAKAAERDAKRAQAAESRKPAHMSKVQKAGEKLPALTESAQKLFASATADLTGADLAALALHIQHFNRVQATERAISAKIEEGMRVTIVGGDPRFVGKVGTVAKAQRIRCYVDLEGVNKPLYLFTSDVVPAPAEELETEEETEAVTDEVAQVEETLATEEPASDVAPEATGTDGLTAGQTAGAATFGSGPCAVLGPTGCPRIFSVYWDGGYPV